MTPGERRLLRERIDAARRAVAPIDPGLVDLPEPGTRVERSNGRGLSQAVTVTHGTLNAYGRYKCRCEECRAASANARREHRKHPHVAVHGRNGYTNGCRCDVCREGHNAYMRARYRPRTVAP